MDGEEIFDALNAAGSASVKFSAEMYKHEDIKEENMEGWDAAT